MLDEDVSTMGDILAKHFAKNYGATGQLENILVWISNTGDGILLVYVCSLLWHSL